MKDIGLDFSRLDFLRKGKTLYFLEANTNGQWAWLDLKRKHGLLDWMARLINPKTQLRDILPN